MRKYQSPNEAILEPIEKASRDELQALQLQRLKWSISHTYANVAPFREKCLASGVTPDDLKQLADLAKFPFMTKADLRDHYPFGLFAVPRTDIRRLHASSGTTGKSVVVGYTANDLAVWSELVARSLLRLSFLVRCMIVATIFVPTSLQALCYNFMLLH